jgi:hypothetical protein
MGALTLPIALLSFYHALLYRKHMSMDQFIRYPFFTTAILFFTILGYVPAYAIAGALFIIGYGIFRSHHRKFDFISSKT